MSVIYNKSDDKLYFKPNLFLKFLRFFNLLEPGISVLSISKILLWIMTVITVYTFVYYPENLPAILTATGAQTVTLLNYGYRRWIAYIKGKDELQAMPDLVQQVLSPEPEKSNERGELI